MLTDTLGQWGDFAGYKKSVTPLVLHYTQQQQPVC
jgi:hypothetical protein